MLAASGLLRVVLGGCVWVMVACQSSSPTAGEGPAVPPALPPAPTPRPAPKPAPPAAGKFLERAEQVVVGNQHSCALLTGGAVYCWGEGSQGQLGRGSWDDSAVPVRVAGVDQATAIVGGYAHTCALLSSGRVMCWGGDHLEGTGDGSARDRMQPALVLDLDDVVELTATHATTCARRRDGLVFCWGTNLAHRPHGPGPDAHDLPHRMDGLADVHRIAAGGLHLCAIQGADRALVCIGLDHDIGQPDRWQDPVLVVPSGWTGVDAVVTSSAATCFRRNGGKTWTCWGRDVKAPAAAPLPGSERIQAFAFGWTGGCTIDQAGALACWTTTGLGPGQRIERIGPVRGVSFSGAGDMAHTCAVDRQGAVFCWGDNAWHALGDGSTADQPLPVPVLAAESTAAVPLRTAPAPTGQPFTADEIAAGYDETCARRGGEVWCWGQWHGRMVNDPRRTRTRPERIEGLPAKAVDIAAGFGTMCARLATGQVWCWGENDRGQLGDGTRQRHLVPVAVKGLADATALALAYGRGCALRTTNQVSCWSGIDPPADLAALAPRRGQIAEVAQGEGHICVRLRSGAVLCQGANDHGQIGNGEGGCVPDPQDVGCSGPHARCRPREICAKSDPFVPVIGLKDATALSLGSGSSCALRAGGRVSCWGNGSQGRLGVGEPVATIVTTAKEIPGLVGVKSLASDDSHTCAVLADRRLVCWGQNVWGELGDRTKQDRFSPSAVFGMTDAIEVSAGMSHTCARRADRTVWCWGDNDRNILGVGIDEDISRLTTPHPVLN